MTGNSGNEDCFRVERMGSDMGMWFRAKTATSGVTNCQDDAVNAVTPGKTYTYGVRVFNADGVRQRSDPFCDTILFLFPGRKTQFSAGQNDLVASAFGLLGTFGVCRATYRSSTS